MIWLSADCVMPSFAAARVKLRSSLPRERRGDRSHLLGSLISPPNDFIQNLSPNHGSEEVLGSGQPSGGSPVTVKKARTNDKRNQGQDRRGDGGKQRVRRGNRAAAFRAGRDGGTRRAACGPA